MGMQCRRLADPTWPDFLNIALQSATGDVRGVPVNLRVPGVANRWMTWLAGPLAQAS